LTVIFAIPSGFEGGIAVETAIATADFGAFVAAGVEQV